jgi:hypothetical protein
MAFDLVSWWKVIVIQVIPMGVKQSPEMVVSLV